MALHGLKCERGKKILKRRGFLGVRTGKSGRFASLILTSIKHLRRWYADDTNVFLDTDYPDNAEGDMITDWADLTDGKGDTDYTDNADGNFDYE